VRLAATSTAAIEEPDDPADLPDYLKPRPERKKKKSRSRKRSRSRKHRSRSRRKKRKSRSMVRWLDRSRSHSHTATGQYIRATGCSSTVKWWEKKRESSSDSSSAARKRRTTQDDDISSRRPRQVAVKGNWAQFVQGGQSYFYNVLTGQTTWQMPKDFDAGPSRRPWEVAQQPAAGAAAAVAAPLRSRPTGALL